VERASEIPRFDSLLSGACAARVSRSHMASSTQVRRRRRVSAGERLEARGETWVTRFDTSPLRPDLATREDSHTPLSLRNLVSMGTLGGFDKLESLD